uniref:Uncharacterized protein n=1 Tax=Anguilla anguilla TaxID=7936 RepID=A0A0E9WNQ3_ANGAN
MYCTILLITLITRTLQTVSSITDLRHGNLLKSIETPLENGQGMWTSSIKSMWCWKPAPRQQ